MIATVPHVTSGLGLKKFQADGFFLTRVYSRESILIYTHPKLGRLYHMSEENHPSNESRDSAENCFLLQVKCPSILTDSN